MLSELKKIKLEDNFCIWNIGKWWADEEKDLLIENIFGENNQKNCLIVYITSAVTSSDGRHNNIMQMRKLSEIIADNGYNIDVTNVYDINVKYNKKYDLVVNADPFCNRTYLGHINDDCIQIAYMTTSEHRFNNKAELNRIEYLRKRKGITLTARRQLEEPCRNIEEYKIFLFIGNNYNLQKFGRIKLPLTYYLPNTGYIVDRCDEKNRRTNAFLTILSVGAIHKGLDILLDVFSKDNCDSDLYICWAGIEIETDFVELYKMELFKTSNIHVLGYVYPNSALFREVAGKCNYIIAPSCSEGLSGSVLMGMSFGLIPIVSKDCGFNEEEAIILKDCNVDTVSRYIDEYSKKQSEWIAEMRERSYNLVKKRFSMNNYCKIIQDALGSLSL